MLETKLPDPVPPEITLSVKEGDAVVDQQMPRAVTGASPSLVIFPPETADEDVIEETDVVVSVGITATLVVNDNSFPYEVPIAFVAYDLT